MILGVFAGLSLRALSLPLPSGGMPSSCELAAATGAMCCDDDHHPTGEHDKSAKGGDDQTSDDDCDAGHHHHHHFFCSLGFVVLDELASCRVPVPASLPLGMQLSNVRLPDGPFFKLEKPPLN